MMASGASETSGPICKACGGEWRGHTHEQKVKCSQTIEEKKLYSRNDYQ